MRLQPKLPPSEMIGFQSSYVIAYNCFIKFSHVYSEHGPTSLEANHVST